MTYPNDPNQGGWNRGSQGQGGDPAWGDFGRQDPPPTRSPGQQPPPTQAFGWQPQQPPAQFGQQPPGGMPPGPPYGPPPPGWGPSGPGGPPRRSRAGLWIALGVAVLLIAGGLTTWLVLRKTDSATTADPGTTSPTTSQSAPINPSKDPRTTDSQTTDSQTADSQTADSQTTDSQTADSQTADSQTTDSQTADSPTTEKSTADKTTADKTTQDKTSQDKTTADKTSQDKTTAAAPSVAVGDCIRVKDVKSVVISRSVVDCGDTDAVYQVTDIVATKTDCDPEEAHLPGASGGLPNQVLCLLATLKKGDCWRAGSAAANGDYEKIDCATAKSTDNKVVFESRTDADPTQCPKGSKPLSYQKRKVLFCYAPAS